MELERTRGCGSCGLCSAGDGGRMRLVLKPIEGLRSGQTVVVAVDRSVSMRSVLLLFGLPLAGLVGGAVLGRFLPIPGLGADLSSAALAVAFLAVTLGVAVLYERRLAPRSLPPPRILRIESE